MGRCGAVQDNFYYWQSYDTLRRLAMTSLVVVVKIMAPGFEVLYVVFLSVGGLLVQAYLTPFKDDGDDTLTLMFMANEFFVAQTMLCQQRWEGWSGSSAAGIILSAFTSGSLVLALYHADVLSKMKEAFRVGVSSAWQLCERGRGNKVAPDFDPVVEVPARPLDLDTSNVRLPPRAALQPARCA